MATGRIRVAMAGLLLAALVATVVAREERQGTLESEKMFESEGGRLDMWRSDRYETLRNAGIEAGRIHLRERGLLLPKYTDSSLLIYCTRGSAMMGMSLPMGARRDYRTIRKGQVVAVPRGMVYWFYNTGESGEGGRCGDNGRREEERERERKGERESHRREEDREREEEREHERRRRQEERQREEEEERERRQRREERERQRQEEERERERERKDGGREEEERERQEERERERKRREEEREREERREREEEKERERRRREEEERERAEDREREGERQRERKRREEEERAREREREEHGRKHGENREEASGECELVAIADTSLAAVERGRCTSFMLAGGRTEQCGGVMQGFSKDMLAQAWDVDEQTVERLTTSQRETGIIRVEENHPFHQLMRRECRRMNDQGGGSMESMSMMHFMYDLETANCDHYSSKGGCMTVLNRYRLPVLKTLRPDTGLGAIRTDLEPDAMVAPGYMSNAHTLVYCSKGSARVQVIRPNGERCYDAELQEGQMIMIPMGYPAIKRAGRGGCRLIAFTTSDLPIKMHVAGRDNVMRNMPRELLMAAFNVEEEPVTELMGHRTRHAAILPPSRQERERGPDEGRRHAGFALPIDIELFFKNLLKN